MSEMNTCPVCGGQQLDFACFRGDGKRVLRCSQCDLGFLDTIPSDDELESTYDGGYFFGNEETRKNYGYSRHFDGTLFQGSFNELLINDIRLLTQKEISDISVVDVGCAFGQIVHIFHNLGADAIGIDISHEAVAYGRKSKPFLKLIHGSIEDADLPKGSFDCITMIDVLEHTPKPGQMVSRCLQLLRPGGILCIYTPNFGCFDIVETEWAGLHKGYEHVLYFDHRSLQYLLEVNGFKILAHKTVNSLPLVEKHNARTINGFPQRILEPCLNGIIRIVPERLYFKLRKAKHILLSHPIQWSVSDEYYHLLLYARKPGGEG